MKTTIQLTLLWCGAFFLSTALEAQTNVVLDHQHVDFRILYNAAATNRLSIVARNEDAHIGYETNQALLVVKQQAQYPGGLPPGTPFGNAGDAIWILPQSQNTNLLYLGISAEGIANGSFDGNTLTFQLKSVKSPGNFFGWQAGSTGGLDVKMNTRDGISSADKTTPLIGSHEHFNWGFSSNGVYCVTFQASGIVAGEGTNTFSPDATFQFNVLPLRPFEQWQSTNWPFATPAIMVNPEGDPDGDGIVNAMEYALKLNPNVSSRQGIPELVIANVSGTNYGALRFTRRKPATDVSYEVLASNQITGGVWETLSQVFSVVDNGDTETVIIRDYVPVTNMAQRFLRLKVRLLGGSNYGCGCF